MDEASRIQALRRLAVMDTDPTAELDEVVQVLARTLQTTCAAVTLVDSDRQWFKASVGIAFTQTPRAVAFCDHTIRQDEVLVVEDATQDVRFAANPLVVGDPGIRFYAGAPVLTHDGRPVGSLCVFDPEPRAVTPFEREVLLHFAGRVGAMLERAASAPLPTSSPGAVRRSQLEAVVRRSLADGTVAVDYQPVYDLATGRVVAAEALLRLRDTTGTVLPAADVVDVAETSGAIVELGRQVLSLAAEQSARWTAELGVVVPVAVNVSAAQLSAPGFCDDVLRSIAQAGISPRAVSLELTESVLLDVGSPGVAQLRELSHAGVALAIDDFGTGYASLTYLRDLPAATLKIDRSFVAGIPTNHRDTAIVAGVIGLARSFGLTCIAEGIETAEQLEFLAARGVQGQGYLLGRALSGDAVSALISDPDQVAWLSLPSDGTPASARDYAGDRRDAAGNERDHAGACRDSAGDRRDEVGRRRDEVADLRDVAGDRRDVAAFARDELAEARDRAGERRDVAAERRDRIAERTQIDATLDGGVLIQLSPSDERYEAATDRIRAREDRAAGARERVLTRGDRGTAKQDRTAGALARLHSQDDRDTATADRGSGAGERVTAGGDRDDSHTDRVVAAEARRSASTDELTGLYSRNAGLHELRRQVARSRREKHGLVLAFVDADGLKHLNDTLGHAAGDRLLVSLAGSLTGHLRDYDVVARFGGDEFLCVMPDMTLLMASDRLDQANDALSEGPAVFTYGLALLGPDDTVNTLVARADAAMYAKRRDRKSS